jgi:class 3 adenylate cyclase/tetratricopeptide (TPR) repeat protein
VTSRAHRKVVTVLFCDVVGSTELGESVDPEALQALLARYFDRMKAIVESHGGTVEKFIGDAVMAVFGVPATHEDDALRACRAAVEMRDALPELGIDGRIGVNTGEVLTGTEERLATGDAVNVAARLEQAGEPGEVLIGPETFELVGGAVDVGEARLLELKGKSRPVEGRPLLAVLQVPERSHAFRFVGRARELGELAATWDQALAGSRCELVTVVGDPGVGKSRLVAEALGRIDAPIVRGRCLSYGEGITYWPVVEVLKQLDALPRDPAAAAAIRSLLDEGGAGSGTDEIAWAFRKLLEEQAPLVVSFDDIQWGEETFLDLVESIGLLSSGAPLLVVCMARPELLDRRPGWPAALRLSPLPPEEAKELVGPNVPTDTREHIVRASGGNPLFLTEMTALGGGEGGSVEIPATLRALLAARIDQLEESDRRVLERGAVEGELFHRGAVQALDAEETEVTPRLASLVRRDLVHPDRPLLPREDAFRFRHLLIRDAAYDALPKATRADLHRRFAGWLEQHGQDLVELDEILGYHLEQAARYLEELGRPEPELALAAGDRLGAAGTRAERRGDFVAALGLIERSLVLTRPHRLDVHLELDLARLNMFRDAPRSVAIAEELVSRAEAATDEAAAALARAVLADLRLHAGVGPADEVEKLALEALPLLEAVGDDEGLAQVWAALSAVANLGSRYEDWARAIERAITHARIRWPDSRLWGLGVALAQGPRPAAEALAAFDAVLPAQPQPNDLTLRGILLAMLGRIDEAWEIALPAHARSQELGWMLNDADMAEIAILAGDDAVAADYLRRACDATEASRSFAALSTYAPMLGCVLCRLGRYDEAETFVAKGREYGDPGDVMTQLLWRQGNALVRSSRGEHADAERLAREAVDWAERSDSPSNQGDCYVVLAEVLEAAGRRDDALSAWREALDRYERKGIVPLVRRVRERLASLQPV